MGLPRLLLFITEAHAKPGVEPELGVLSGPPGVRVMLQDVR